MPELWWTNGIVFGVEHVDMEGEDGVDYVIVFHLGIFSLILKKYIT